MEGEREGGMEGGREGGRERGKDGRREDGKEMSEGQEGMTVVEHFTKSVSSFILDSGSVTKTGDGCVCA